jgi:hypothetical protein
MGLGGEEGKEEPCFEGTEACEGASGSVCSEPAEEFDFQEWFHGSTSVLMALP